MFSRTIEPTNETLPSNNIDKILQLWDSFVIIIKIRWEKIKWENCLIDHTWSERSLCGCSPMTCTWLQLTTQVWSLTPIFGYLICSSKNKVLLKTNRENRLVQWPNLKPRTRRERWLRSPQTQPYCDEMMPFIDSCVVSFRGICRGLVSDICLEHFLIF